MLPQEIWKKSRKKYIINKICLSAVNKIHHLLAPFFSNEIHVLRTLPCLGYASQSILFIYLYTHLCIY